MSYHVQLQGVCTCFVAINMQPSMSSRFLVPEPDAPDVLAVSIFSRRLSRAYLSRAVEVFLTLENKLLGRTCGSDRRCVLHD